MINHSFGYPREMELQLPSKEILEIGKGRLSKRVKVAIVNFGTRLVECKSIRKTKTRYLS